ncbi:MAG: hypothetical protein H7210_13330, partial [Pyrinomonadaceae bacterium]|nr:hypothetical protein [Phycisphaerales bacterium]
GKREEGRGKREEGRGKREEGRGKREEGRGKSIYSIENAHLREVGVGGVVVGSDL